MYKVIKEFADLQDAKPTKAGIMYHNYRVGDIYPRKGYNPSDVRIAELAGSDNRRGDPLIIEEGGADVRGCNHADRGDSTVTGDGNADQDDHQPYGLTPKELAYVILRGWNSF